MWYIRECTEKSLRVFLRKTHRLAAALLTPLVLTVRRTVIHYLGAAALPLAREAYQSFQFKALLDKRGKSRRQREDFSRGSHKNRGRMFRIPLTYNFTGQLNGARPVVFLQDHHLIIFITLPTITAHMMTAIIIHHKIIFFLCSSAALFLLLPILPLGTF